MAFLRPAPIFPDTSDPRHFGREVPVKRWIERSSAEKVMYALLGVVAVLLVFVWTVGILEGRVESVQRSILSVLVIIGLPTVVYFLVPGPKKVRAAAALATLVATDALDAYAFGLRDHMYLVENWELTAVLAAAGVIGWVRR